MIRVVLPHHLRTLARVEREVQLEVEGQVTQGSVLDALEASYPMLRGTIRDHTSQQRRPFVRFFACGQDLSHDAAGHAAARSRRHRRRATNGDRRHGWRLALSRMCRSIKTLANFEPPATDDEIRAAAVQFVRKLSGASKPSRANEVVFDRAVDEVTEAASRLVRSLASSAPPRNREVEAQKARARASERYAKL